MGGVAADPEREAARRARIAESNRKRWADPEARARRITAMKATFATPESKTKRALATKTQWQDPTTRAQRVDGVSAAHREGRMGDYAWFKGLTGEQASRWTGDAVGYRGTHQRIVAERGKATEHPCIDCGRQANEWSFSDRRGHSPCIEDYAPRCYSCHRRYDRGSQLD